LAANIYARLKLIANSAVDAAMGEVVGRTVRKKMRTHRRRFVIRFAISAFVALATPAVAAGLVEGVSATAVTVADATQPLTPDDGASGVNGRVATHGPARLSVLVGSGDIAGQDLKSRTSH
jgi:hypothetical protein